MIHTAHNWSCPGPAAFDFRSDTKTHPTQAMLLSIASASLLDDDSREDPTTLTLESTIAQMTGKEAALFVASGTMGNQLCIRAHLSYPPYGVLADARAHIVTSEAGGVASLSGAMVTAVRPGNGLYLTLEDIQRHFNRGELVTDCPTRVIVLENPINGVIVPLDECQRIRDWVKETNVDVKMHLDGARLWEVEAAGAGSLHDFCDCFDSAMLCFSKGLGAPVGSILVGDLEFRERARRVRKSVGGGMRQPGLLCAMAGVGVRQTFEGGVLKVAQERAREIGGFWEGHGGRLRYPVQTNMVWLDLEREGVTVGEWVRTGEEKGVKVMGERLVVHYQISEEGVERLKGVMLDVLKLKLIK
ncbi:threonine aldolase family protein [Aspergillus undulatus]|uniref:threonine aldolase family protein n=1 Tax=Aspergillus undulatus TaxID=1810928 RepID=UPI003CCD6D73